MPFIPSVKVDYGEPLGRPLKIAELAGLLKAAPDHLRLMLMILIGTACRPEAALELTGAQLDFDDRLIDLNPRGRAQTKKFRPVVKMPDALATVLANAPSGRLVTFQGRPVKKINKAWRGMRAAAGLDEEVNPYSIRHTVARWMRQNGVPAWEVAAQLGHKSRDYRTTELYAAFDPAYLENAVRAIDLLFERLRASFAPVDEPFFGPSADNALKWIGNLERARGFEPPTPTLARLCSTPELHPRPGDQYHRGGGGLQEACCASGSRRFGTRPCNADGAPHRPGMPPMPPHAPLTPEQLFAWLDALGIPHRTYAHPPVFTVAESAALRGSLPGGHCKSLFLKDRKGGLWLVVALEERRIDLKLLADSLGAPRFSFGSPELLREVLGVAPGSVTPFALANDTSTPSRGCARQRDAGARPAQLSSARQRPHHRDRAARSAALYRGLRPQPSHC